MIFFQTQKLLEMKKESNESGRIYIKHSLQELSELLDQAVQHED
jgi:hypothetical protein